MKRILAMDLITDISVCEQTELPQLLVLID